MLDNTKNYDKVTDLVYVRLVEACNLFCKHCFIPANPKKMTMSQCMDIPNIVREIAKKGSVINIRWHGGEPTLFGAHRLRRVLEVLGDDPDTTYIHDIQTNLVNFDSSWAELYHDFFGGEVGVSWDWKVRLLDAHEPKSYLDFNALFFSKLEQLAGFDLKVNLVITVTKEFIYWFENNPTELFMWINKYPIKSIHFEKLTKTGRAKDYWGDIGVSHREYSVFMAKLYDHNKVFNSGFPCDFMGISPICTRALDVLSLDSSTTSAALTGCLSGVCDTSFHTIDSNGYKFGCTALTSEYDNVNSSDGEVVSLITIEDVAAARTTRIASCEGCRYRRICNSGCLASSKTDGSGECAGGRMLFKYIEEDLKNEKIKII